MPVWDQISILKEKFTHLMFLRGLGSTVISDQVPNAAILNILHKKAPLICKLLSSAYQVVVPQDELKARRLRL